MYRRCAVLLAALLVLAGACNARVSTPLPSTSPSAWTRPPATGAPTTTAPRAVTPTSPAAALKVVDYTVTRPTTVTGTWPVLCHARGKLPDAHCTPGSVAPRAKEQVCVVGFENAVRPRDAAQAKTAAIRAYGLQYVDRTTIELDHLVPLSLGGSNDVSNLWPEVSDIPNAGFRNTKDAVERHILAAVCSPGSKLSLLSAQSALARDWTTALATLGIR